MSNYTKTTNFTAKDSLSSGDANKLIKGSEFDTEFTNIATAIATKEDTANKGAANGYAPLNSSTKLADSYLTSNVPLLDAATNTFTGDIVAVDGTFSGTVLIGGTAPWTADNDGSGSGLDADLVRGTTPSAFGLTLLDDADAATARTTLGLGTAATQASTAFETADAAIVKSDEAETITANWSFSGVVDFDKVYTPAVSDSISGGSLTISCLDSNVFYVSMNQNVTTLTLSSPSDGQTINVFLTQDATGSRTMAWPASFKWPNGSAGVLSTAANSIDLLVATYRGTTWYATLLKAFA